MVIIGYYQFLQKVQEIKFRCPTVIIRFTKDIFAYTLRCNTHNTVELTCILHVHFKFMKISEDQKMWRIQCQTHELHKEWEHVPHTKRLHWKQISRVLFF